MPRIDDFIRELRSHGAERLVIASGKPVTLTVEGGERRISAAELDHGEVESLLAEILPSAVSEDTGRHQFHYDSEEGSVQVTVRRTDRFAQVLVFPRESGPADEGADGVPVPEAPADAGPAGPGNGTSPAEPAGGGPVPPGGPAGAAPEARPLPRGEGPGAAAPRSPAAPHGAPAAGGASSTSPALELREDAPAVERLFVRMVEAGCSDLHVSAENVPLFRKDGHMVDLGGAPRLSPKQTETMLMAITPDRYRKQFEERHDADFAYEIPGVARFRCNLFMDRKGMGGVFRQIPARILTAEELGLPPQLLELCHLRKGLVLVTGPTGSGKSTTLAALIDYINKNRSEHIITIEDPIEFVHENRKCLINQREVGEHTMGFKVALRAALREDPDVVLVGEMRDLETVHIALETAETGHLVFGTLHTNTAPSTVSRIIDQFPPGQQAQIRTMLADSLEGVVAQTLCRRKGGGRIAALEVLMVTNAVANLIREDKSFQIPSMMQTGKGQGMQTMNDALLELVKKGLVAPAEAYRHAAEKAEFRSLLQRNHIDLDRRDPAAHALE